MVWGILWLIGFVWVMAMCKASSRSDRWEEEMISDIKQEIALDNTYRE